jgi:hypothetical protein
MAILDTVKKWEERMQTATSLFVTLTALPFIGKFISMIFGKGKEEPTSTEIKAGGKGLGENLILSVLKNELVGPGEITKLEQLEDDLAADPDRGKERLVAFQVYLAKLVKENSRQQKKVTKPKKDEDGPTKETSYTDLAIEVGKKFVIRIIGKTTYPEQKKILEREGVFSEMPKPKTPSPLIELASNNKFETLLVLLLSPYFLYKVVIWLFGG